MYILRCQGLLDKTTLSNNLKLQFYHASLIYMCVFIYVCMSVFIYLFIFLRQGFSVLALAVLELALGVQAGLEPTKTHLPLPHECLGLKGYATTARRVLFLACYTS